MRNRIVYIAAIQLIVLIGLISISRAQNKTLQTKVDMDSYLEQVKKNNPAYKATQQASEGAKLRATEGTLLILPELQVEASQAVDETEPTNANAQGTKSSKNAYSVSLLQNTTFGLAGKLSYGQNHFLIDGATPAFVPRSDYYRNSPSIELTQSLWKNGFGSEIRASRNAINAAAEATQYAERAKNLGIIIEAQNAYYKLYYSKKTIEAFKESMEAAGKLKAWAKKRLDQALGEQSDYYQTKAAYELRELEYLNALQEEKSAARAFNSMKGIDSDLVTEELTAPKQLTFNKQNFSEKVWRDDVRAAHKAALAAKSKSLIDKERNSPTLDLYGKYAWNGLGNTSGEAHDKSLEDDHPAYVVGVKFTTPLALGKSHDVRKGYEQEAIAQDLSFKRKAQEQERDYNDLLSKIENANLRFKLASTLEESQRIKAESERKRHGRGRTTFFQVLQFEQDYLSSQLSKIKTEAELNALLTQLQMYRGE